MSHKLPSSPSRTNRRTSSPLRSPSRQIGSPQFLSRQASAPVMSSRSNGHAVSIAVEDTPDWVSRERVRRAKEREDADKREQERDMNVFLQQERREHRQAIVQSRHHVKEVQAKVNRATLKLEKCDAEIDRLNGERTKQMERFDRMIEELLLEKQRAEESAASQIERAQGERLLLFEEQEFVQYQLGKAEHELADLEDSWEHDAGESLSPQRNRKSLNDSRGSARGESPRRPALQSSLPLQLHHQASAGSCGITPYHINLGQSSCPQAVAGPFPQAPAGALPQAPFSNFRVANVSPTASPSRVGVPVNSFVPPANSLQHNGVAMNTPLPPSVFVGTPVMQPRVLYNKLPVGGGPPKEPIA